MSEYMCEYDVIDVRNDKLIKQFLEDIYEALEHWGWAR